MLGSEGVHSLPGSSVHGFLQARRLEWVAISFSRGSSQPGIEPGSHALQADSLPSEPSRKPYWIQKCPVECVPDLYSGLSAKHGPSELQHIFIVLFRELTAILFNSVSEELEPA